MKTSRAVPQDKSFRFFGFFELSTQAATETYPAERLSCRKDKSVFFSIKSVQAFTICPALSRWLGRLVVNGGRSKGRVGFASTAHGACAGPVLVLGH